MANRALRSGTIMERLRADKDKIKQMYLGGMSHQEIADIYECSRQLISTRARILGIYGIFKTSSRMRAGKHQNWKGGKTVYKNRLMVLDDSRPMNNRYVAEHRIIAEKAIGRTLTQKEVVHHINGNPRDNRNCNLLICSNRYHSWLENKMAFLYKQEKFNHV